MGIVNSGIPIEEATYLRDTMGLRVAVEGGTYRGGTTKLLSGLFEKVYTIEKSRQMYEESMRNLAGIANVQMLLGDTRTNLRTILQSEDEILFWLDAHWSGGETYGEQDECPIIEELELILSSNLSKFAIMIDDARLFMAPPPAPHNYEVWPSLTDIMAVLPKNFDMIIWNDVIFLTPKELIFRKHMQTRATYEWMNGPHRYGRGFKSGLRSVLRLMGRK